MKSIIRKGIIPARIQSQDKKFQTSRPCEVRRSGQITTFVVCVVFSLSFQAVVLLTKTAINRQFFSIKSEMSGWTREIQTILSQGTFTLQSYGSFFRKFSSEVEKCIMWSSMQVLPNQVSKKSFYKFEDIGL